MLVLRRPLLMAAHLRSDVFYLQHVVRSRDVDGPTPGSAWNQSALLPEIIMQRMSKKTGVF